MILSMQDKKFSDSKMMVVCHLKELMAYITYINLLLSMPLIHKMNCATNRLG